MLGVVIMCLNWATCYHWTVVSVRYHYRTERHAISELLYQWGITTELSDMLSVNCCISEVSLHKSRLWATCYQWTVVSVGYHYRTERHAISELLYQWGITTELSDMLSVNCCISEVSLKKSRLCMLLSTIQISSSSCH